MVVGKGYGWRRKNFCDRVTNTRGCFRTARPFVERAQSSIIFCARNSDAFGGFNNRRLTEAIIHSGG